MSFDMDNVAFRRVPREMLHDQPFMEGQAKLHVGVPGEANNLVYTATTPEAGMIGMARLDFRPGGWLGKVIVGVDPELNGQTSEVIDALTEKLQPGARRLGLTALEVFQRVERTPDDGLVESQWPDDPYVEKPIKRVGL